MKTFKYILLLCCASIISACSSSDDSYKEARNNLSASTQTGIYRDGKVLLLFDKTVHQYYCNPTQKLFRIQDSQGNSYTTLQLDALPSQQTKTNGKIEGNMGINIGNIPQLYLLKSSNEFIWLWSDEIGMGLILPNVGL